MTLTELKAEIRYVGSDRVPYGVAFNCPCGCGTELWIPFERDGFTAQRWKYTGSSIDDMTLTPSLLMTTPCRSHFWIRDGKVVMA